MSETQRGAKPFGYGKNTIGCILFCNYDKYGDACQANGSVSFFSIIEKTDKRTLNSFLTAVLI